MSGSEYPSPFANARESSAELERITKLLLRRDLMLSEANRELDEKVRSLEATQQDLLRASEYLNSLLFNSPDAIWVLDSEGKVASFNASAEELTGYTAEEVLGKPLDFMFCEETPYRRLLQGEETERSFPNLHAAIRRRDGERLDLLLSVAVIHEPTVLGEAISILSISKDLTREMRLEKALREANELLEEKVRQRTCDLESLSQRLAVLNQVATVASQSLELEPLLGNILKVVLELTGFSMGAISTFEQDDLVRVRAVTNVPEDLLVKLRALNQRNSLLAHARDDAELQVSPPLAPGLFEAGVRLWVVVPLKAKGRVQGVMSLFATTDREVSEDERHLMLAIGVQAGWTLENARLYEQVCEDVVKLKEVDRIKTEFIATISHELRTPLTSIIGFMRYAQIAAEELKRPDLLRYIQVSLENGQKLARMIDDLLAMQKLESGTLRFRLEPVDLRGLLERLADNLGPQLQAKHQTFVLDLPADLPPLNVDQEQFERAMLNLIINAIKFSDGPGTITVSACRLDRATRVTVADTGIGMTPEVREKIFERFYQAESSFTRRTGGVGLGLAIAKRIIEIHHGTLSVDSAPHQGSRFEVELPDAGEEPAHEQS
jgi:PAS domain S-box-containing protein